jgi:hypothetical protein
MSESNKWLEIIGTIGVILTALFTGLYWRLAKKRGEPIFSLVIEQVQGNRLKGKIIIDNAGPGVLCVVGFKAGKPKGLRIALEVDAYSQGATGEISSEPIPIKSVTIDYALNVPPRESKSVSLAMDLPSNTRRASLVSILAISMASNSFLPVRQIKNVARARLIPLVAKKVEL